MRVLGRAGDFRVALPRDFLHLEDIHEDSLADLCHQQFA
jgi:hypothetical protein